MDYSQIIGAILATKKINEQQQLQKLKMEDRFYKEQAKLALPFVISRQIAMRLVRLITKPR